MGAIVPKMACSVESAPLIRSGKRIIGVAHFERETIPKALHFLHALVNKYPYNMLMADRYSLDEINTAFLDADRHKAIRATIVLG
jgi:hypothetical protein